MPSTAAPAPSRRAGGQQGDRGLSTGRLVRVLIPLIAVLIALGGIAVADEGPRLPVSSFTLENGLQVVVVEDHRSPVVTHMVWYRVGSADERAGKSGIAHFLEHLMFKGTETLGPGEFSEKVALNGGTDNAFTAQDYTAYHQRIARDRLDIVMALEADRMVNLRLDESEVDLEREVVLEERARRYGNEPGAQLAEQMDAALYLNHPYGRPIIGWEHEIEELDRADAVEFYERHYTPANAILVIAGDVTPDEVRTLAEGTYGAIANRTEAVPRQRPREPPQSAARRVILEHPQVTVERWRRTFLVPSFSTASPQTRAALELLGQVLGGGSAGRLYRALVIEEKVAVDAGAYYSGTALDYGEFGVHAIPARGVSMEVLEQRVEAVIGDLVAGAIEAGELDRAKIQVIAELVFDQDSQGRMARTFGAALATGASVEDVVKWPADVRSASEEDVVAAAREHLVKTRSVTGVLLGDDDAREAVQ
jgi:zinc protease